MNKCLKKDNLEQSKLTQVSSIFYISLINPKLTTCVLKVAEFFERTETAQSVLFYKSATFIPLYVGEGYPKT